MIAVRYMREQNKNIEKRKKNYIRVTKKKKKKKVGMTIAQKSKPTGMKVISSQQSLHIIRHTQAVSYREL